MKDHDENPIIKQEPKTASFVNEAPKPAELKDPKLKATAIITLIAGIALSALGCIITLYFQTNWGLALLLIGMFVIALALDMLKYLYPDKL